MIDVEGAHQALCDAASGRQPVAALVRRRTSDRLHLAAARLGPALGRRCAGAASRPPRDPTALRRAHPLTPPGVDVDEFWWSPNGRHIAATSQRLPDLLTSQIHLVDPATGEDRFVAGESTPGRPARWLPDGSGLLMVSDADGWFQVVRVSADGRDRASDDGPA